MVKQSFGPALPVLVTRPKTQGQAFAKRLVDRFGAEVLPFLSPLIAPSFLSPALPGGDFSAVLFTSYTGVLASQPLHASLPTLAYCVGRWTAETARDAGFQAISADGDAAALMYLILTDPPKGRLLHLRGEDSRGNLAEGLSAAGVPTTSLVVYRQVPQLFTAEALALLRAEGPVILPVFSPRSAALLAKALPADTRAELYLAAFSPAVAEAAAAILHAQLITAARPDADAMLEAVAKLIVAVSPP